MRKRVRIVCLTMAMALIMTVIATPSYGVKVDVHILLQWDGPTSTCKIQVIGVSERFRGVCKGAAPQPGKCEGDSFSWTVIPGACSTHKPDWELFIVNPPGHPVCFSLAQPGLVKKFDATNLGPQDSGSPHHSCTLDKYGTYWPYVVVLEDGSGTRMDTTDPGGIIFP